MSGRDDEVLAARLAREAREREHAERVKALQDTVAALTERVERIEKAAGRISSGLDTLLAERRDLRPAAIHWPDLDPDTRAERWGELEKWIDTVLADYEDTISLLRRHRCWPAHPAAVAAVTAAWQTWVHAYRNPASGIEASATWQERWRPAMTTQIKAALRECDTDRCVLAGRG